jgi:hypothetical protein
MMQDGVTKMKNSLRFSALLLAGGLSACVVAPPAGPSVAAMPGAGKNFDQFEADDAACRGFAASRMPGNTVQASQQNSVGTAIGGAALGATAGALVGSTVAAVGTGAAVGAGLGLLAGSAVAADNSGANAYGLQYSYDVAYAQCMAAKGNNVPNPATYAPREPYYGSPYYYGYPAAYWGYPGVVYYGGWGGRGRWR